MNTPPYYTEEMNHMVKDLLALANELPEAALSNQYKTRIRNILTMESFSNIHLSMVMRIIIQAIEDYTNQSEQNPLCLSNLRLMLATVTSLQYNVIGQVSILLSHVQVSAAKLDVTKVDNMTVLMTQICTARNMLYDMHISSATKAKAVTDIIIMIYELQKLQKNSCDSELVQKELDSMMQNIRTANALLDTVL